jgi:hypothetical protein
VPSPDGRPWRAVPGIGGMTKKMGTNPAQRGSAAVSPTAPETLAPDEKIAKFAAYSAARDLRQNEETCGMLLHCLIHPVGPLLSFLAPLFGRFCSPVRGLRRAVAERRNPLTLLVFFINFARRAGPLKSFSPVIRAKTGERRTGPPSRISAESGNPGAYIDVILGSFSVRYSDPTHAAAGNREEEA